MPRRAALAVVCIVALALCGPGHTETGTKKEGDHARSHGTEAHTPAVQPAARLVHPDGSASSASVNIRPHVVQIQPNESLPKVLDRNQLSSDGSTVEGIRRMNPTLNLEDRKSVV